MGSRDAGGGPAGAVRQAVWHRTQLTTRRQGGSLAGCVGFGRELGGGREGRGKVKTVTVKNGSEGFLRRCWFSLVILL